MKENVTAEVFPTLRNISLSAQDVCRLCGHCGRPGCSRVCGVRSRGATIGGGTCLDRGVAPGTYTASAPGKKGPVTVEVRMSENAIESVEIVEFEDTERISAPARERVPQQIVELQSLNVDTVAGATLTSMAHHRGRGWLRQPGERRRFGAEEGRIAGEVG